MIVVVGCGSKKLDHAAPAAELYQGGYFKLRLAYARQLTSDENIFILSALHGFIPLDRVIEPYDLRMGQPGSIHPADLKAQAEQFGMFQDRWTVLAGIDYIKACLALTSNIITPLRGKVGEQMAWLKGQLNVPVD